MGRKRQKVRWLSIEETGSSSPHPSSEEGLTGKEEDVLLMVQSESERGNSLSPGEHTGKAPYSRRPVAPRFERKAAAEVFYESSRNQFNRSRELNGEDLPMGFTKIRSKNLDVLFKRDYYSTKGGGLNSEANTHSETSSLTQKEEEEDKELEVEDDFEVVSPGEEEEIVSQQVEEEGNPNTNNTAATGANTSASSSAPSKIPKVSSSKLNSSSSPFYPSSSSSSSYVMSLQHPYMTGRPNLFLYSPSSNTMIPCEEVVVPGMFPGSPSSPQNLYMAAYPMEGSHPYMMAPPYVHQPYYPQQQQAVYSDAEPCSAESTMPHSPPELSAYNPTCWGADRYYSSSNYGSFPLETSGYPTHPQENSYPQEAPKKEDPVITTVPTAINPGSNDVDGSVQRVPGLPPQPKKTQKKKRKKKNNNSHKQGSINSELIHRNSTSSEENEKIQLTTTTTKEDSSINQEEEEKQKAFIKPSISVDESSSKSIDESRSASPVSVSEEEVEESKISLEIRNNSSSSSIVKSDKAEVVVQSNPTPIQETPVDEQKEVEEVMAVNPSPPSPSTNELILEEEIESATSTKELHPEPVVQEEVVIESLEKVPQVENQERPSNVVLEENEISKENDILEACNSRMLYSSVVSQSMPLPKSPPLITPISPSKSPSKASPRVETTAKNSKKKKSSTSSPLPEIETNDINEAKEQQDEEGEEWLSSRKKVKRHRSQSKKLSKTNYSPNTTNASSPHIARSTSQEKPPKELVSIPPLEDIPPSSLPTEDSSSSASLKESPVPIEEPSTSTEATPSPPLNTNINSKKLSKKKKKQRETSSSTSSSQENTPSRKPVLICDGDIDVSSSFSSLKRVSDIGNYRLQPLVKGLDTLFISDVGLGIRNGPIMSGRPLRVGKYNPPDRTEEILSMKASLVNEEATAEAEANNDSSTPNKNNTPTPQKENAQYMPLD